jgi:hypothetical protein
MDEQAPITPGTCSEIMVTIKDDERSLKTKYLSYDAYSVHADDPILKTMIAKALQDFNGEPTDIKVRINLEVL